VQGWATLRELMTNSHERNGKPGFWATSRCAGFWSTAPSVPRDERNPEDVDTRSVDHWLDAARYAAVANVWIPRNRSIDDVLYGDGAADRINREFWDNVYGKDIDSLRAPQ
jgi:hypothetical protein